MSIIVAILKAIAMPFIQAAIAMGLKAFEAKYPGIGAVIQKLIDAIKGGAQTAELESHVDKFTCLPGPSDLVR